VLFDLSGVDTKNGFTLDAKTNTDTEIALDFFANDTAGNEYSFFAQTAMQADTSVSLLDATNDAGTKLGGISQGSFLS
jgi:hypothetical protein